MTQKPPLNLFRFDNRFEMVTAIQTAISERLLTDLMRSGRASWAVSGGSTPAPLFEAMSETGLNWANVDVALVDERWVDVDHPRSNEAFVCRRLLRGRAEKANFTGMKTDHPTPAEGLAELNENYGALLLPFSSILLGMGPDGHTASFFPGAEGLDAALDPAGKDTCRALVARKSDVTGEEIERVSITAPAIMAAKHVALMITGQEKRHVLQAALTTDPDLPVGRLHKLRAFDIYWAP
ncbi:MAG: 6-phosphogluconolactonase [Kordiimonadales bacterium]|nr:MAG: 6-phosphogluconolactonase [Kordiimonadales bacterium]